jgi:hypothetical protein
MMTRWPRWVWFLAGVVLVGMVVVGVPTIRGLILRAAGRALDVDEPVERADIIVVAVDADGAGVLEAADLVHSGIAMRVAVFADPPDPVVDREFIRRGIPYEDAAARSVRQLRLLGVTAIEQIPRVSGTEAEGQVLPQWADENHFHSVVVVSMPDHARRLRRVLHRSLKGHQTRVTIRSTRYSTFNPDQWWETREGIRTAIIELEKLLLDVIRHPFAAFE